MILFLAKYPNDGQEQEGMLQRIVAIDEQFASQERNYLFISHRQYWKKQKREIKPGVFQYHCNSFLHFFLIVSLLRKANSYYLHAVVHFLAFLIYLPFISKNKAFIWDIHGVAPEEQALAGAHKRARQYEICERILVQRASTAIAVTNRMIRHYKEKFPHATLNYIVYGILPAHLRSQHFEWKEIRDTAGTVNIVYSGNTQKWQNIALMVELIKRNQMAHYHYYILTGEPKEMQRYLQKAGIDSASTITVKKVLPGELKKYYSIAHYGFVLRDDIAVNQVACPTKMVEYLYYGIVPIVKSADIGDFLSLGYQYLSLQAFGGDLLPIKSPINHQLASRLLENRHRLPIEELIHKKHV